MWGRRRNSDVSVPSQPAEPPSPLRLAMRQARIDEAERTGVVVDLHDAEVARLEILSEALDPLFADIPAHIDLFDRAISRGENPRLWIDSIAHVAMGRDKRSYRLLQDTRYGRKVLTETVHVSDMVDAVTRYVAQRMIERERALAAHMLPLRGPVGRHRGLVRALALFALGLLVGVAVLVVAALMSAPKG